jgi:phosphate transport system protein
MHTDRAYEAELRELRDKLLRMAGLVEEMIADATTALCDGDLEIARRTIDTDTTVNALEVETDELCLLLLAKRQPLASDLRMITLAMKMVTDLERIGDLGVNISERVLALGCVPSPNVVVRIQRMSRSRDRWCTTRSTVSSPAMSTRRAACSCATRKSTTCIAS